MSQCHRDEIEKVLPHYYDTANSISNIIHTLDIESASILRSLDRRFGQVEWNEHSLNLLEQTLDRFNQSIKDNYESIH